MTGSASATSSKICRDRRVGKIRTPDDELRDSLTGSRLPNSIADSPRPNAPAGRHLVARRRRTTPSQIQKPAEGPLFQPSLDLNIDPAPVHPLTRSILPQPPARAPIQSCSSYSPHLTRRTPPSHRHPHYSVSHTCTSSSSRPPHLHLLKPTEPSPVTRPVQELLICSSYSPRPRVCSWDRQGESTHPHGAVTHTGGPSSVTDTGQGLRV